MHIQGDGAEMDASPEVERPPATNDCVRILRPPAEGRSLSPASCHSCLGRASSCSAAAAAAAAIAGTGGCCKACGSCQAGGSCARHQGSCAGGEASLGIMPYAAVQERRHYCCACAAARTTICITNLQDVDLAVVSRIACFSTTLSSA